MNWLRRRRWKMWLMPVSILPGAAASAACAATAILIIDATRAAGGGRAGEGSPTAPRGGPGGGAGTPRAGRLAGRRRRGGQQADIEQREPREEDVLRLGSRPPRQPGEPGDGAGEVEGDQAAQDRAPARRREPRQEVEEGNQDAV